MKNITKKLLTAAAAIAVLVLLVACEKGEEIKPSSDTAPKSVSETDVSEIRDAAGSFIDALKKQDVVKMETMGGVPVDTYGDWSRVIIEKLLTSERSVTRDRAVYVIEVTVADNGGSGKIAVGLNVYTLTVTFDSDAGMYEFDFVKEK